MTKKFKVHFEVEFEDDNLVSPPNCLWVKQNLKSSVVRGLHEVTPEGWLVPLSFNVWDVAE